VLLAAIIVAVFLVSGAWLTVLLLPLPIWVGVAVTSFAVLLLLGVVAFRKVRAVAKAAALERELMRQASQAAEQARPDRRAEVLALQANMKQAIEALKRSKLAKKGGKSALYALPWYVIVGPPAAGKTTALEQSGLAFSSPVANAPKIKGTAGTRNCDWWFSQEAILLDTAGRFATDDDDREEWVAFLETIKRFRSERPLDGVIVALSTSDLAGSTDAQLDDLAAKLRSRIDEITERLEMVVPIYVMLTKADLVAGFVEFFGDLGKQQRGQPWGATFLMDDERLADPARAIDTEFEVLVKALHARMVERLSREPMPEVRTRVLQFPVELQAMRAPLAHFVEQLVQVNPYRETPILRGFYFTSGTQVGRPMDRVLANMARGFDLGPLPAVGQPQGQSFSYFVTDLFRNIVFPDRHLAVRSTSLVERYARRQVFYGVGALFLTMLLVLPAAITFINDNDLVHATARDVDEVTRLEKTKGRGSAAVTEALGILAERIKILEQAKSGFRIPGLVGSSAAAPLYEPVRSLYASRVREIVDGAVKKRIREDLRASGESSRGDSEAFQSSYDTLKLYLMMSSATDHLDVEWATPRLADKWSRALRGEVALESDKLLPPARFYLEGLGADKSWAWQAEESLVARVRARLVGLSLIDLQYGWLLRGTESIPSIRPEHFFTSPSDQFIEPRSRDVEVPGAYTTAGWDKVRATLDSSEGTPAIEPWVMGGVVRGAEESQKINVEQLREMYFRKYQQAWSDFLGGIKVQIPQDLPGAIDELSAFSERDGPYRRMFKSVSDNLRLDTEPTTLTGKALEKGKDLLAGALEKAGKDAGTLGERKPSPVEQNFKSLLQFVGGEPSGAKADAAPSGLSQYLDLIANLAIVLRQLQQSKAGATPEFRGELTRTAASVERLLLRVDGNTRLLLDPLLMNPVRASGKAAETQENSVLQEKWKSEVYDIYSEKIAPRYPFADAPEEVPLPEFSDFFRPTTGVMWKFYDKNLTAFLDRNGNNFVPKPTVEAGFRADFMRCLTHAAEITDALYGTAPEPVVPFGLRMHAVGSAVSEIVFRVDGQVTTYRNEPEQWVGAQWPGKATPRMASIQVKGAGFTDEIKRNGDFGFYRLLAAGNIKAGGPEGSYGLSFTWSRPGISLVPVDIRPSKGVNPFGADFFKRLKCPLEVLAAIAPPPEEPLPKPRRHVR
jgi:type VI secretion system protein ImpL